MAASTAAYRDNVRRISASVTGSGGPYYVPPMARGRAAEDAELVGRAADVRPARGRAAVADPAAAVEEAGQG